MLIAAKKNDAQTLLMQGVDKIKWTDTQLKKYASNLLKSVYFFEEAVNEVMEKTALVEQYLEEIKDCETQAISSKLKEILKVIGDFDLEDLSNLEVWVAQLNVKIESILVRRLEGMLQMWVEEF